MKTILCFGDSNTHGTVPIVDLAVRARYDSDTRWPCVMAAALGPAWKIIEEGLPGRTTLHDDPIEGAHKNGMTMLPGLLETHTPIDVVIVMLGTNDLKPRFSMSPFDIACSVEKLILAIGASAAGAAGRAPDIMIIAPPPVLENGVLAEMFEGGASKSRGLASNIGEVARRYGCAFLDAGEIIASSEIDGVHFEGSAHRELGTRVAQLVDETFA